MRRNLARVYRLEQRLRGQGHRTMWDWMAGVAEWDELDPDQQDEIRPLLEVGFIKADTIEDQIRLALGPE